MEFYKVTLVVEADGPADSDPRITKVVEAMDENSALTMARHLVCAENPEHNVAKIWAWGIERSRVGRNLMI